MCVILITNYNIYLSIIIKKRIINNVGHYENFPVASILAPKKLRPAIISIYKFARSADDIADEGIASLEQRLQALNQYNIYLTEISSNKITKNTPSLFIDLKFHIKNHQLNVVYFQQLLQAFIKDVQHKTYATMDDLLEYCKYSANPVGRLILKLYKSSDEANNQYSDKICTALQLINFYQDVSIDFSKNRIYLPTSILDEYELNSQIILTFINNKNCHLDKKWTAWQGMLSKQIKDAQNMLIDGLPLCKQVHRRFSFELKCIIFAANHLCNKIKYKNYDVFNHRPVLKWCDWLAIVYKAIRG